MFLDFILTFLTDSILLQDQQLTKNMFSILIVFPAISVHIVLAARGKLNSYNSQLKVNHYRHCAYKFGHFA